MRGVFSPLQKVLVVSVGLLCLGQAGAGKKETAASSLEAQIKVMLNSISYHLSPSIEKLPDIVIALAYDDSVPGAKVAEAKAAFAASKDIKVGQKPFRTVEVAFSEIDDLKKKLIENKANVVYIPGGSESAARRVVTATRGLKMLSLAGDANYVHWAGVCLGVEEKGAKRQILVNLSGCKLEDVRFDPRLLRIAVVSF